MAMLVSREMSEWWARTTEYSEGQLVADKLATRGQLRKLKAGESFIDSNGRRWWKYKNEWPLSSALWSGQPKNKWRYFDSPLPEAEPEPRPYDAVRGSNEPQPRPYDAVRGGKA